MARNSAERALEKALDNLTRALEASQRQQRQGVAGGPGPGQGIVDRVLPQGRAPGGTFGGGFQQGIGAGALQARVAGAGGVGAFAGQIAGRAALGGVGALAAGVVAGGAKVAGAALDAAAKGQDISAGAMFGLQKSVLSNIPLLGENASQAVTTTERTIADLNSLTGDLAAQGFDTEGIRQRAAPILREQNRRRLADEIRNADVAKLANEAETNFGRLSRSLHEQYNNAGMQGHK